MTGVYIVNGLLFVIPCILLLYLVFRDQIKVPRPPVVAAAIAGFSAVDLLASQVYLWTDTPIQKALISIAAQLAGVILFTAASSYTFGRSLFIITVVKN